MAMRQVALRLSSHAAAFAAPGLRRHAGLNTLRLLPAARAHCTTRATSEASSGIGATPVASPIKTFSPSQNPQLTAACVQTFTAALAQDPLFTTAAAASSAGGLVHRLSQQKVLLFPDEEQLLVVDDDALAAAQLLPYPYVHVPFWRQLSSDMEDLYAIFKHVQPSLLPMFLKLVGEVEKTKKDFAEEHGGRMLHLVIITTKPEAQGKGLGSRLLREITGRADREGQWLYLEASSRGSQRLYLRHGFQDVKVLHMADTPVFIMARPPQPLAARQ